MSSRFSAEQVRAAQVMLALAEAEGREPDGWTTLVANAVPATDVQPMMVTADQVDNARLLLAIDRARGREPEEWISTLADATTT